MTFIMQNMRCSVHVLYGFALVRLLFGCVWRGAGLRTAVGLVLVELVAFCRGMFVCWRGAVLRTAVAVVGC